MSRRKALAAASVGEFVEYYDFAIYGYLALSISANFFANEDPTVALLSAFAIYGVAFVARPLGGLFFGYIGDKFGRRQALIATLLLIGLSTTLIGVLPNYAAIGIAAPLTLLLCRLLQGFSAGGEAVGASSLAIEHAPVNRRGLYNCIVVSFSAVPSAVAALLILTLSTSVSAETFDAWVWRVPFIIAFPITVVALIIRLRAEESPLFLEEKARDRAPKTPIRDAVRNHYRLMLFVFFICSLSALGFYLLIGYFVTFMQGPGGLTREQALLSNCVAIVVFAIGLILAGRVSDIIGRRPMLLVGGPAVALVALPSFILVSSGSIVAALIGQSLLAFALAIYGGGSYLVFVEIFPTAVRYTGSAISFNISFALFGGTAPFVSTWLVDIIGSSVAPGYYLAVVALMATAAALFIPETKRSDISTVSEKPPKAKA